LQEYHAVSVGRTHDDFAVERPLAFAIFPQLGVCPGIEGSEAVLSGDEDIGLSMMFHEEWRCMVRADGSIFLPNNPAGSFIKTNQITRALVMIPREQHGILQNEGTHSVPPCHFGIAEYGHVPCDPYQCAVVGVAGNI
jgi:hypothetical protein